MRLSLSMCMVAFVFVFSISCGQKKGPPKFNSQKPLSLGNKLLIGSDKGQLPQAQENEKGEKNSDDDGSFGTEGIQIKIAKVALGHRFLMTAAQISTHPTPTGNSQASKVVFFEKKEKGLFLFESTRGKLSTNSVPTKILITEFEITNESEDYLTFNFKEGMNLLFFQATYYASDDPTPAPKHVPVVKTLKSFIDKAELRGKYLFIDQYNRIEVPSAKGPAHFNLQVKYTFSTYIEKPNFPSKKTNGQKVVGYFEVHPTIEAGSGKTAVNIMKFDTTKPIVYSLSNNIPPEFVQAVTDGVLYWNKVFGKELLKVDKLPKNTGVHEPGYHIVQWLHWDTAGFAYANMQADPFTGENLQSHIYMTSVFGVGGLKKAKRQYKKYLANSTEMPKKKGQQSRFILGIKGFSSTEICHYDGGKNLKNLFAQVIKAAEQGSNDEDAEKIYLRFAQDYIRSVTAHEIGHTLGLRHNFAGSTATNITPLLLPAVEKTYFLTGELLEGILPGSTVMDYTQTLGSAMIGAHIRHGREALSYDKQAIEWGYSEKTTEEIKFDRFCTDSHRLLKVYHDCKVWDFLENPFQSAQWAWKNALSDLPFDLAMAYQFLEKKEAPLSGEERIKKIKEIVLTPKKDAEALLKGALAPLMAMFSKTAQFIGVKQHFPVISSFNEKEYKDRTSLFQKESLGDIGGFYQAFFKYFTMDKNNETLLTKQMSQNLGLILHKTYGKITTAEEFKLLQKQFQKYLIIFEVELMESFSKTLQDQIFNIGDGTLAEMITKLSDKILFLKSQDKLVDLEKGGEQTISFYRPLFNQSLRQSYVKLLTHKLFPDSPSFNRKGKKEILAKHLLELKNVVGDVANDDLPDHLFDWKMSEGRIFAPVLLER